MNEPQQQDLSSVMQVRSNPSLYLSPGKTPSLRDVALELANDALYLGAQRVVIELLESWFLVAASSDWVLQGSKHAVPEVFFRIQLFHSYRRNATRATILPLAFAQNVITFLAGEPTVLVGCKNGFQEVQAFVEVRHPLDRVVAFQGPLL